MSLGFVLIGRNEGQRLINAFDSLPENSLIVYVDSGSNDNSINEAIKRGIHVVELDSTKAFSAGRARNTGWKKLMEINPTLEFVQFLDGDCMLEKEWIETALLTLEREPNTGIVCGQRTEIKPDGSIYNQLIDEEWNTPIGYNLACGGDFIIRSQILQKVGGFNENFIAGEEPEMCFRIRQLGHEIHRIDCIMTHHDAAIYSLKQWLKRAKRTGYAYCLGYLAHGDSKEQYYKKEFFRSLFWPFILTIMPALWLISWVLGISILLLIFVHIMKMYHSYKGQSKLPLKKAILTFITKFSECLGVVSCLRANFLGFENKIIEYK